MAQNSRKLNFMIDNDVACELEKLVPAGQRSKVVTQAIVHELALHRRKNITDRLLNLRSQAPKASGKKLLSELAADRQRN
ncbi:MAG: hypothetical protein Q8O28_08285 [Smithellaceae bacterium]|nr:hypothetical protein [Smithellaceae bacterium]